MTLKLTGQYSCLVSVDSSAVHWLLMFEGARP
jgi:hypothetical protein